MEWEFRAVGGTVFLRCAMWVKIWQLEKRGSQFRVLKKKMLKLEIKYQL